MPWRFADLARGERSEDLDRPYELLGGQREWEPQVALEQSCGGEARARRELEAPTAGLEREARADRLGQPCPDEQSAGGERVAPLGQELVEGSSQGRPANSDH